MPQTPFLVPSGLTIQTGEIQGSATAVQLPTITVTNYALIKAQSTNSGSVYIGSSSSVTAPDGVTDTTSGYELASGQEMEVYVQNLDQLYLICDNAGDDIVYIVY